MDAPERDWVWLARIRRPQGRKGEVFADLLTDFPEKFAQRRQLWLLPHSQSETSAAPSNPSHTHVTRSSPQLSASPQLLELMHHWPHKGGIVLHFAGIDSISAAEALAGCAVAIPRDQRATLSEDEFYISDLIGCALVDIAGLEPRSIGQIENIERDTGPVPLLLIRAASGEVLIPFAKNYLRRIDLTARRVEMALPEGLVDLNE